jgi:hypothetical protein
LTKRAASTRSLARLALRHLLAFPARLRKADGDRLLSAFHGLAAPELFSVPLLRSCIAFSTFLEAPVEYFLAIAILLSVPVSAGNLPKNS